MFITFLKACKIVLGILLEELSIGIFYKFIETDCPKTGAKYLCFSFCVEVSSGSASLVLCYFT